MSTSDVVLIEVSAHQLGVIAHNVTAAPQGTIQWDTQRLLACRAMELWRTLIGTRVGLLTGAERSACRVLFALTAAEADDVLRITIPKAAQESDTRGDVWDAAAMFDVRAAITRARRVGPATSADHVVYRFRLDEPGLIHSVLLCGGDRSTLAPTSELCLDRVLVRLDALDAALKSFSEDSRSTAPGNVEAPFAAERVEALVLAQQYRGSLSFFSRLEDSDLELYIPSVKNLTRAHLADIGHRLDDGISDADEHEL